MRTSDPFVPIPKDIIPKMLELASLKPGEKLFDLGSGDGRILIVAASEFHANATGVEVRPALVRECLKKIHELGLSRNVSVLRESFRNVNLNETDVLALYLSGYALKTLVPKFRRELKKGARIVTFDFPIDGLKPKSEISIVPRGWRKAHPIYLYVML
ncbi:MAG: SAM-dependent methyltransferase [Nitrososphaerales archaeon]